MNYPEYWRWRILPRVKLILPSVLAEGGDRNKELEASTLKDVIEYLCKIKPELRDRIISPNGELNRFFNFYVNGVNAYFINGASTLLKDGDEVSVIPALGGGRSGDKNITDEEFELYSRQIVLNVIGFEGQEKLKNSRVAIVGLGGLGSPIAMTLTAMGVGYIRIIDRDVVEKSNLHRQHLYTFKDIGSPKVEAASKRLREMNPYVEIDPYPVYIDDSTALEAVRDVDVVLDGLDNFKARRAINKACYKLSIPYVYASAIETYGMVTTLISREGPCLECIFPNTSDQNLPTCSTVGVHPSILQIISSIEVYEGVNILTGRRPRLFGRLLIYDLEDLSTTFLDVKKSSNCSVCGEGEVIEQIVKYPQIEETCSREGKITFIINPGRIHPIEIQKLAKIISEHGYLVSNISELGLTFRLDGNITFSILKTGVGIIEGAESREYALRVYEDILKKVISF